MLVFLTSNLIDSSSNCFKMNLRMEIPTLKQILLPNYKKQFYFKNLVEIKLHFLGGVLEDLSLFTLAWVQTSSNPLTKDSLNFLEIMDTLRQIFNMYHQENRILFKFLFQSKSNSNTNLNSMIPQEFFTVCLTKFW